MKGDLEDLVQKARAYGSRLRAEERFLCARLRSLEAGKVGKEGGISGICADKIVE